MRSLSHLSVMLACSRLSVNGNNRKAGVARTGSGRERGHGKACPLSLPDPVRAIPAFQLFPLTRSLDQAMVMHAKSTSLRIANSATSVIFGARDMTLATTILRTFCFG